MGVSGRHDNLPCANDCLAALAADPDAVRARPIRRHFDSKAFGAGHDLHIAGLKGRPQRGGFRIHLGVEPAQVRVALGTQDTRARIAIINAARDWSHIDARASELSCNLCDLWIVRQGRVRKRRRAGRVTGIAVGRAMDPIEALGFCVIGFKVGIGDWPGWR